MWTKPQVARTFRLNWISSPYKNNYALFLAFFSPSKNGRVCSCNCHTRVSMSFFIDWGFFVQFFLASGVNLSLLSRVMSSRLSRGTYNGGLLSTEAGTIARVIADATITLAGYLGQSRLLNFTLLPSLLICVSSIIATCFTYNSLYWYIQKQKIYSLYNSIPDFFPAVQLIFIIYLCILYGRKRGLWLFFILIKKNLVPSYWGLKRLLLPNFHLVEDNFSAT